MLEMFRTYCIYNNGAYHETPYCIHIFGKKHYMSTNTYFVAYVLRGFVSWSQTSAPEQLAPSLAKGDEGRNDADQGGEGDEGFEEGDEGYEDDEGYEGDEGHPKGDEGYQCGQGEGAPQNGPQEPGVTTSH